MGDLGLGRRLSVVILLAGPLGVGAVVGLAAGLAVAAGLALALAEAVGLGFLGACG